MAPAIHATNVVFTRQEILLLNSKDELKKKIYTCWHEVVYALGSYNSTDINQLNEPTGFTFYFLGFFYEADKINV